ncbi:MAG: hypothetical protein B7Z80_00185 [Rhodospirillales bacterium 20-64-7]|nr:MAG: hypothetical protein B7Z80_00185 [Rhodospirillales bacterium 20-64-7]HQT75440.1 glycosyltransferase family 4 protein [Rhodopila sp.]
MSRARLLLADRVKSPRDSFLVPLLPALQAQFETRFISTAPGDELAQAIGWADIIWLEWCWDHAVWATRNGVLAGKPCIVRLHSIEALQTHYPAQVDWQRVSRLVTVAPDIAAVVRTGFPAIAATVPIDIIPNGIDMQRFSQGRPERRRVAWVGHLEPKKNPMLLMQIAHRLRQCDPRYTVHVAGSFTDLRTARYMRQMQAALNLAGTVHFDGQVADMPAWYADKGVLLSTSMYESFGLNIGEAMATGAFPVIHGFPGADRLWPEDCLFAATEDAVALILAARPNLYRDWVADRYGLEIQIRRVLSLLQDVIGEAQVPH